MPSTSDLSSNFSASNFSAILGQLIIRVGTAKSEEDIYSAVAKNLPLLIPADRVSVALLASTHNEIEVFVLEGLTVELPKGARLSYSEQTHIGHTLKSQQPTLVMAHEDSEYTDIAHMARKGLVSIMKAPLLVSGESIGTLNVGSRQANLYQESALSALTQIAALMATNIERLRLIQSTQAALARNQDYARRLKILNQIGQQLSSAMTEERAFSIVANAITQLLKADRVSYVVINPDRISCQILALIGNDIIPKATHYPLAGSGIAAIIAKQEAMLFPDLNEFDYPEHQLLASQGLKMAWSVPIQANGEIVGVLNAAVVNPVSFPHEVLTLLTALCGFMGTTIERINAQKKVESTLAVLEHQVLHDQLTGLPNRKQLNQALHQEIAQQPSQPFAILFIDLDDFKGVNDTLSHSVGDQMLRLVAQRLQQHVKQQDLVARMGGDEFVVLLKGILAPKTAIKRAQQLIDFLSAPFTIEEYCKEYCEEHCEEHREKHAIEVGASIGISLFPEHGNTVDELMKQADIAMYSAKSQGRNHCRLYSTEMSEQIQHRLTLEKDLRQAIANEEFFLAFQPQIEMASGHIFAFEALLRWNHPTLGCLSPATFISIAEEANLIGDISHWVLKNSLKTLTDLREQHRELYVSVNISAIDFNHSAQLTQNIATCLAQYDLPGDALELELTESVFLEQPAAANTTIQTWKKQGIRLAIDDFGTGFSSLNYLLNLPIDTLKIDRTFVDEIHTHPRKQGIVKTILALSKNLDAHCIAEGLETTEQFTCLQSLGCKRAQGFLLGKPMPALELIQFIRQNQQSSSVKHGPQKMAHRR